MNATELLPVIVGAGPAGIRAAHTLAAHGLRPVVLDEALRGGGQIYRRPPDNFARPPEALYGMEAAKATRVHQALDGLGERVDYRPQSLVWNAQGGLLDVLHLPTQTTRSVPYTHLIVATGATDRVLPVPGWTLPGVYTLGAAQIALKFQGCTIGRDVVLAGTGPLLYLVAYQYAKAGARVRAVLDHAPLAAQVRALPHMLAQPTTLAKGLYYAAWLHTHGVPIHRGTRVLHMDGTPSAERVGAVVWADAAGREHRTVCDAAALAYALRSETQLADLLGCQFAWNATERAHLPVRDTACRASVPGVYLAGDGAAIRGADAAELAGERAALALLADAGRATGATTSRAHALEAALRPMDRWREAMEVAFPFPQGWAAQAPDALVVCRCENITAGTLRACAREQGADEMNRLKALTRVGMGRCQGRMCGLAAAEILAHATGKPIEQVGRLRAQAPLKPLPIQLRVASDDAPARIGTEAA